MQYCMIYFCKVLCIKYLGSLYLIAGKINLNLKQLKHRFLILVLASDAINRFCVLVHTLM